MKFCDTHNVLKIRWIGYIKKGVEEDCSGVINAIIKKQDRREWPRNRWRNKVKKIFNKLIMYRIEKNSQLELEITRKNKKKRIEI